MNRYYVHQETRRRSRQAFTLLEILIATGIFMTVMVVGVGVFTNTIAGSSASEQLRITAQSSRVIFESLIRDIRAGHGLVFVDQAGRRSTILPPFDCETCGTPNLPPIIRVYQTEKIGVNPAGQNLYIVTRKSYTVTGSSQNRDLRISLATDTSGRGYASGLTAEQIKDFVVAPPSDFWQSVNPDPDPSKRIIDLLPSGQRLDAFDVINYQEYESDPDNQKVKPFLQLRLRVANRRFDSVTRDGRQVKTTLQTTIVPRDFTSPYEVAQQGIQGVVN